MSLKASIGEQIEAKRKFSATPEYRQQRYEQGLCCSCPNERRRYPDAARCASCLAKSRESARQWRAQKPAAVKPEPVAKQYNFDTDDLIVQHYTVAKKMAWWLRAKLPPSTSIDYSDVESDAMYGLVLAGRTYKPASGPFKEWALTNIRSEVYRGFRKWTHGSMKQPPVFVELDVDE